MSFPVAVQSAVFYFIACTPCAKVRHRKKAKEQAKKERLEKARLETEQPGLYRHPSPFNTNPYWHDEIAMGPSLPKKSASKNSSQRGLTSSDRESTAASVSEHTTVAGSRTNVGDSLSTLPKDHGPSDDWNRSRGYQREDEELWGHSHRWMDAFSKARDSAGRLIDATLGIDKEVTDQERRDFYFSPRNPPVNDYHPPVVSGKPPHPDARKWMLQPPPPAKVMEGKVPVSRAMNSGSKSSARTIVSDEPPPECAVFDRLFRDRAKHETDPSSRTEHELIESLFCTRSRLSSSRNRIKSLPLNDSDDSSDHCFDGSRKTRRLPVPTQSGLEPTDDQDDDDAPVMQDGTYLTPGSSHAARRPRLETIPSIDGGRFDRALSRKSTKRSRARRSRTTSFTNSPVGDDSD